LPVAARRRRIGAGGRLRMGSQISSGLKSGNVTKLTYHLSLEGDIRQLHDPAAIGGQAAAIF
jgi:hypothetical protein